MIFISIVEISELRERIVFELINAEPTIGVSSHLQSMFLIPITETKQTLLVWRSDFSADLDR
jgi:hypothetical protein